MMRELKPWAYGPFDIPLNAEMHYRIGEDFDRRIAMVGYDNAIEVSVATYLNLHPTQRGNRSYAKAAVDQWLTNYHTKIDFFFVECTERGVSAVTQKDVIIWFHEVRNGQYHGAGALVPQKKQLDGVRAAAFEVFSVLFEEPDVGLLLELYIAAARPLPPPPRLDEHDRLIDRVYRMIDVCGRPEYVSDVIYALDPNRYRDLALELKSEDDGSAAGDDAVRDTE